MHSGHRPIPAIGHLQIDANPFSCTSAAQRPVSTARSALFCQLNDLPLRFELKLPTPSFNRLSTTLENWSVATLEK